jgi:gamma-glutamyltranspeptidase / glutathione hydrolase
MKCFFSVLSILLLSSCSSIFKINENQAMVVTAHKLASDIGIQVLKDGGNAFDAAIAVNYALAVSYPRAGNIAGGGFMVYRTADGKVGSLDYREKSPMRSNRDMYLDEDKNIVDDLSTLGAMAVAVPGTVAGMDAIHQKFGTKSMLDLLDPSINLAKKGFAINEAQSEKWDQYRDLFLKVNTDSIPYVKSDLWERGDTLKLTELAMTLKLIALNGAKEFYEGETADLIIEAVGDKGILSLEDLRSYTVVWREALSFDYKEFTIHSMAPPSSGGIALAQLFKGIEKYNLDSIGLNSSEYIHLLTELERRVYADRATHLGDPDYYKVPVDLLLDESYIQSRMKNINKGYKTDSENVKPGTVELIESHETTHFSIVDSQGNAVSITTTLNGNFGSKLYVQGAGFLLNNEMDDFSAKPGTANQFGLVGAEANAIEPEKRMLSSMSPTIIEKNGDLFMVLGTPGGSTIITSVFQTAINVIEFDLPINEAVNMPKTHSQWLPDKIYYEHGMDSTLMYNLKEKGHVLHEWNQIGKMAVIHRNEQGELKGSADENRSFGTVAVY